MVSLLNIIQENSIVGLSSTFFFFPPKAIATSLFQMDLRSAVAVVLQKHSMSEVISTFITQLPHIEPGFNMTNSWTNLTSRDF